METMSRRAVLRACGLLSAACVFGLSACRKGYEVELSDAEWRKRLTPAEYAVLRQSSTEKPFSSPLNDEHRQGTFNCAGCGKPLFSSTAKFDSKKGWPSFWAPLSQAVGEKTLETPDGVEHTEVHCAHCGGHLGYVVNDGPKPTGKRYSINGAALKFVAT
jgi:peptide-methionine (R)-S-oxide reductase